MTVRGTGVLLGLLAALAGYLWVAASDPAPPAGWTYGYATGGPSGYTITAAGDNTTITRP